MLIPNSVDGSVPDQVIYQGAQFRLGNLCAAGNQDIPRRHLLAGTDCSVYIRHLICSLSMHTNAFIRARPSQE
ncbi:hypothetical protein [Mycobacterium lepromatosis]|uniref:hypothetical protein n=1 Tax=Mycobacterium lepromatosis TaxID=480418 RepID=UPI001ED9C0E8|nr:hypothetical protein [Mycobacterium lepromatosis]